MKTRDELLKWIAANPAEVLDDMECLKLELSKDSIELSQLKKQLRFWQSFGFKYFEKWRTVKKMAIQMTKIQRDLDAI